MTNRVIRDNIKITRKMKGVEAMLERFFMILISAAALLIVCWMLAEYWLRSVRKLSIEKISSLGILDRMAFAFEDFCGGVNHKKNFRRMRLEEELGSVPTESRQRPRTMEAADKDEKSRDSGYIRKEKRNRIKANM